MRNDCTCTHADNEKRLVRKCRDLNSEIVGNAAKVQTALKLSEEDQQTIVALKKEIEKAWKVVDASHDKVRASVRACAWRPAAAAGACRSHVEAHCNTARARNTALQEAQAKDAVGQLKAEIANLTRLAEAGSALSSGEEATLAELMKQKQDLVRERDAQVRRGVQGAWCSSSSSRWSCNVQPAAHGGLHARTPLACVRMRPRPRSCPAGGAHPGAAHRPHGGV
jgi:hypothetical protein